MRKGPIPLDVHAGIEPVVAIVVIAAPWIFGFSDVHSATAISIIVGVVMLLSGAMTKWRLALVRLIPLRAHFVTDLVLGAFLILAPFIFGFSHNGAATRFTIIVGALELLTALTTRWDPADARDREKRASANVAAAR